MVFGVFYSKYWTIVSQKQLATINRHMIPPSIQTTTNSVWRKLLDGYWVMLFSFCVLHDAKAVWSISNLYLLPQYFYIKIVLN